MRIADVIRAAADGVERVVDVHEGELVLTSYLQLPDGVDYVHAPGDTTDVDAHTLLLDLVGPDPRRHRPLDTLPATLAAARSARRAVVLLGYDADDLPVHRIVDALHDTGGRVSAMVPLDYTHIGAALVVEPGDASRANAEHNLLRLTEFGARTLRSRVHELEAEVEHLRAQLPGDALADDTDEPADAPRTELDELRDEIEELRAAQRRLRELERSTTWKVGLVVVDAIAKPGKRTVKAPVTLAKLFRKRAEQRKLKNATTAGAAKPADVRALAGVRTDRLLTPFAAQPDADLSGTLTIAGVWPAETERILAPDARAVTLQPNHAALQFRRTDPDVVIVQAAAAGAGSPWAALGAPPGLARDVEVRTVLDLAARREVPTVLWFDRPAHLVPGLDALAERFDVVLTDSGPWVDVKKGDAFSLGVQLARFGALSAGASGSGTGAPAFLGSLDPRLGHRRRASLEAVLREAAGRGLRWYDDGAGDDLAGPHLVDPEDLVATRAGYLPANRRPGAYRDHGVWIGMAPLAASTPIHLRTLEQLASGARVVSPVPAVVDGELKRRVFDGSTDPRGALAAACDAPADDAQFTILRELYQRASTARWLARLAQVTGLPVYPERAAATTVVFTDVDASAANVIVAAALGQRERPAAVLLALRPGTSTASLGVVLDTLQREGVHAHVTTATDPAAVAGAVTTPWCTFTGATRLHADHLLDLHVLRACTDSDAVGFGPPGRDTVPVARALVRASLVADGTVRIADGAAGRVWSGGAARVNAIDPVAVGAEA